MRLVEDQPSLRAGFELKAGVGGEQLAQPRLLEIEVRQPGEGLPRQRGLADLAGAQDDHGRKLPPQRAQTQPRQPLPHGCRLEAGLLICKVCSTVITQARQLLRTGFASAAAPVDLADQKPGF